MHELHDTVAPGGAVSKVDNRPMSEAVVIDHPHNEASALLGIQSAGFLASRNWELGFWIVSDELALTEAIAALGRGPSGAWEVVPLRTRSVGKPCEDCETMARAGSLVYVFGSQFGSKDGPLQPKRHFVARFNEALIEEGKHPEVALDVARRPFAIHRLVNDALRELKIATWPVDPKLQEALVLAAVREGREKKKAWRDLVREDDVPVNVEGSTFAEGGVLLLGLRYPVTAEGHPLVVELEGVDRLFDVDAAPPAVRGVRILTSAGDERRPAGIRELDSRGGFIHAVTGDVDTALLGGAEPARSEHWSFRYPVVRAEGAEDVAATRVRAFGKEAQVEGIALDGEEVWYVHDDERIRLERATLP